MPDMSRKAEEGEQCMDCGEESPTLYYCAACEHDFCEECYNEACSECLACVAGAWVLTAECMSLRERDER